MLAYVFWHWARPTVDAALYIANLKSFHETLSANKPQGFHYSTVFQGTGINWLDTTGPAFEDWYLLDDSAAMDPLNDGAVTGVCEKPHNIIAKDAAGGTAGVYRLKIGTADLQNKTVALWLSKPEGMPYKDFFDLVRTNCYAETALWQRQMTLGPTTEFCLLTESEATIPNGFSGQKVSLQLVWSGI